MDTVPPQEAIERRLVSHKVAAKVEVPFDYDPRRHQSIQRGTSSASTRPRWPTRPTIRAA